MSGEYGCNEYRALSRRSFLQKSAVTTAAIAAMPAWLPRVAMANSYGSNRDVVVSIYLRGGIDGLTACVPHGDNNYYTLRPTLNVPRPDSAAQLRAIDLDGFFGLPPSLSALLPVYQQGDLLFVHATGLVHSTKSHFDAQRFMEVGLPGSVSLVSGWLGRHLANTNASMPGAPLRAASFGYSLPRTLVGGPNSTPIPNPADYNISGTSSTRNERRARLTEMYNADAALQSVAAQTQATIDLLAQVGAGSYQPAPGVTYGTDSFNVAMRNTAALIKSDVGVEAIHVDFGGWDTHANQGVLSGTMATNLTRLGNGMATLYADLNHSGHISNTVIVAMSEFGRVARENGSAGTDHGHGNMMILIGGGVVGGRVFSDWPGLGAGQLYQNQDLDITTDYRDVLWEMVRKRLGNTSPGVVFPEYTGSEWGLFEG
jgi:uncharacterized protein (DUF1501 family)